MIFSGTLGIIVNDFIVIGFCLGCKKEHCLSENEYKRKPCIFMPLQFHQMEKEIIFVTLQ
jgi:hypothetical protein